VEVLAQLQRALFPRDLIDATRQAYVARKAAAYETLGATVDEGGRKIAKGYLDSFFQSVESDAESYRPVVIDRSPRIYVDAARTQAACGTGELPLETRVSRPLETSGHMARVLVLDAH
jgi:hypothetical protein